MPLVAGPGTGDAAAAAAGVRGPDVEPGKGACGGRDRSFIRWGGRGRLEIMTGGMIGGREQRVL